MLGNKGVDEMPQNQHPKQSPVVAQALQFLPANCSYPRTARPTRHGDTSRVTGSPVFHLLSVSDHMLRHVVELCWVAVLAPQNLRTKRVDVLLFRCVLSMF